MQLFRSHPVLLVWLIILTLAGLLCAIIGIAMSRSGMSLRPLYWFAGFFMIIGVPQVIGILILARITLKTEAPRARALEQLATSADPVTRSPAAQLLFGSDADADLVRDARSLFGEATAKSKRAQFAVLPGGETVLIAQFNGASKASNAWFHYLRDTGLNQLGGRGDSQRGYAVTRPQGDRAYVVQLNSLLGVWTGSDDAAIRRRMAAAGFKTPARAPLESATLPPQNGRRGIRTNQMFGKLAIASGCAVYVLIVAGYFFKGSAWASGAEPRPGVAPLNIAELAENLEALNASEAPYEIVRGSKPNEWFATWRFADARWIDLARARGIRRVFRIQLTLNETARLVRATDYSARHDWSAGSGGADIRWKASMGILFFQAERANVAGVQLDDAGKPTGGISYAYQFNAGELKEPLKAIVTSAGWRWRPVAWQGPKALRWLTE
ncbi:MAG TPA: hypothetical protein VEH04_08785 [Verrucomicrobiae bacterium]|nr:hypothetical protein [Verrucomicrobiae bacterium]